MIISSQKIKAKSNHLFMNIIQQQLLRRKAKKEAYQNILKHRLRQQKDPKNTVIWVFVAIGLLAVITNILAESMKN